MEQSRRNILKTMLGGGVATLALGAESPLQLKIAPVGANAASGTKTLIKIFIRGGLDGLHMFTPYGDPYYAGHRPNLKVDAPGAGANACLALNNFFGLHPAFSPLMTIWNNGDMAIIPATHFPFSSRSHFENQRIIERGALSKTYKDGYFNRFLAATSSPNEVRAVSAGQNSTTASLYGPVPVPAINKLENYYIDTTEWCGTCEGIAYDDQLQKMYATTPSDATEIERYAYQSARDMNSKIGVIQEVLATTDGKVATYSSANLGPGLKTLAQLLKGGITPEIATLNWNRGFDTHNNQRPEGIDASNMFFPLHAALNEGAQNLLTFYNDIAAYRDDVTILLGTEFGREVKENGTFGTDHGHASAWWAIGGSVNSGFHGGWPGLEESKLHQGRFLAQQVDYRDLVSEALVKTQGASAASLAATFPGYSYQPLGVFA